MCIDDIEISEIREYYSSYLKKGYGENDALSLSVRDYGTSLVKSINKLKGEIGVDKDTIEPLNHSILLKSDTDPLPENIAIEELKKSFDQEKVNETFFLKAKSLLEKIGVLRKSDSSLLDEEIEDKVDFVLRKAEEKEDIIKSRGSVYANTRENRKLGRVGQEYGGSNTQKEDDKKVSFQVVGKDGKKYQAVKSSGGGNKYQAYQDGKRVADGLISSKRDFEDMVNDHINTSNKELKEKQKDMKNSQKSFNDQISTIVKNNKDLSELDSSLRLSIIDSLIGDFLKNASNDIDKWKEFSSSNNIKTKEDLIKLIDSRING
tara:strand:+ start:7343 stop:8299 length:957 start_codon:yes stop_codon:yes gene_type:complete